MIEGIILFSFNGFLGAFTSVLLKSRSIKELKSFSSIKRYILGLIVGYIYFILHSEYNFPNSFMCFIFGYFCEDVITKIILMFKVK